MKDAQHEDCTCLSTECDPLRHEPDCAWLAAELAGLRMGRKLERKEDK